MKIRQMRGQLEEVWINVDKVAALIESGGYFTEAKKILQNSAEELKNNNIAQSLELVNKARESALKEKKILSKLEEAQSLISKKLPGSNPELSTTYYEQCLELLIEGKVDKADMVADETKIAAKPSPEYLLQKARETYSKGLKKYEEEQFQDAIELLKTSIDEYGRAKSIAEEKKDQNMIANINSAIAKVNDHLEDVKIAFDNLSSPLFNF